jgi:hypothetical protein
LCKQTAHKAGRLAMASRPPPPATSFVVIVPKPATDMARPGLGHVSTSGRLVDGLGRADNGRNPDERPIDRRERTTGRPVHYGRIVPNEQKNQSVAEQGAGGRPSSAAFRECAVAIDFFANSSSGAGLPLLSATLLPLTTLSLRPTCLRMPPPPPTAPSARPRSK